MKSYSQHYTVRVSSGFSSLGNYKAYNQKEALKFHRIHSEHVQLFNDGYIAQRVESFCKGICFSARPVAIGEVVTLRVSHVSIELAAYYVEVFALYNKRYAMPYLTDAPAM